MRRLAFFLLLMVLCGAVKFRDRIWWERPCFKTEPVLYGDALVFKTPYSYSRAFFTERGIFVFSNGQLLVLNPSFEKIAPTAQLVPPDRGRKPLFLAVSRDGNSFIAGFNGKGEGLLLEKGELQGEEWRKIRIVLKHPLLEDRASRCQPEPGFAASWNGSRLLLWVGCGKRKGSLFVIRTEAGGKVEAVREGAGLIGLGHEFTAWASPSGKGIRIEGHGKSFVVEGAGPDAFLSSSWLLYRKGPESRTWFLYNLRERKVAASFKLESSRVRPLYLTPSGKRVFFDGELEGRRYLFCYDLHRKKAYAILPLSQEETGGFQSCYDGEFFLFTCRGQLWAGYLPDYEPPSIEVKIFPLFRGRALTERVKLQVKVQDRCFVSGALPWVEIDGRRYSLASPAELTLKPGRNLLRIRAWDRAGNVSEKQKEVYYEKPIRVSLRQIGENPSLYYGKVVLIEGRAWGFMAPSPPEAKGLPFAKGCEAKTRSWGSIEDGTAVALYPVPPTFSGRIRVYALIKPYRRGWLIEPLFEEKLPEKR